MRNFTQDAKELLEGKVPIELSEYIRKAKTCGVTFKIGKKSSGTIYGEVSQDAVGIGWIYIDIGGSNKAGGHVKIDMADVKTWKWGEKFKELTLELK